MKVLIREATPGDLPAINAIYNHYVQHSTCTYQTESTSDNERSAWFASRGPEHPVIVAELDTQIVGWGSLSPFHPRSAYRHTVENAVYVRHDLQRRGIGAALLGSLVQRARSLGHHSIVALIDAAQAGSIALHQRFGFREVGRLKEVGYKFGRWLDVVYLQRFLGAED